MSEQNREGLRSIRRALLSVSDKTGLVEFARALGRLGVELLSTGGTAKALREAGINVRDVSEVTGFPEMLDGRVKTLHPRIHGGLLAVRENAEHMSALAEHDIEPIDMVVINLYPFEQTVARADTTLAEAVEQIDIGGPAMVRSAAKNYADVAVVTAPELYERILREMGKHDGALSLATRAQLARLAFMRTAFYDSKVFSYLGALSETNESEGWAIYPPIESIVDTVETYADVLAGAFAAAGDAAGEEADDDAADSEFDEYAELSLNKLSDLRYGENPHQAAALYEIEEEDAGGVARAELLSGKEMSFNNYVDADAAWQLACDFAEPACAIIKHTNPAGVGLGASPAEAYRRALATDPVSAFGGIVAFNHAVDEEAARAVTEIFTEVIIAPGYDEAALTTLRARKNLRVLRAAAPGVGEEAAAAILHYDYKKIGGGMLVQTRDLHRLTRADLKVVSRRAPTDEEIDALLFAWTVCKHTKSNAIVYARAGQTVGVGAGQMSRVDSVRLGATRAQLPVAGSALASDAFFPFRDGIDEAARHGITALIQPGGSVRDQEIIDAADEHGLAMVFTGIRHFKH